MRFEYEDATDQVLARGHRREAIFRDDRDRTEFLRRLEIACGRMGGSIRAYVLMGNHSIWCLTRPYPIWWKA